MKKRLFLFTTLLFLAGLFGFFGISVYITHSNNVKLAEDMVVETAWTYAGLYRAETDLSSFVEAKGKMRITVIAPDGEVLADSLPLELTSLENHLNRPEVQAAAEGSPAAFIRNSESFGLVFIYYALKVSSGDGFVFIRAAMPVAEIDAYLGQSLPLLVIVLLIVSLLCFIVSRGIINRTTKPFESVGEKLRQLSNGEYISEPVAGSYEEINQITEGIDEVALLLQNSISELRSEKTKLSYILDNIGDGLVILDNDKRVTLINAAAMKIFGVKPEIIGKKLNYLSFDQALTAAVDECIIHEKAVLLELALIGHIFLLAVKRLPDTELTMVALSDVTESRENAKQREEFFANASHELKTPLTAIKGFNELTAINNNDENITKFVDGITRETERMLTLIGDMLKLSELENTQTANLAPTSLAKAVGEVQTVLSSVISEKSITFETAGDAIVNAGPEHVYELVKNLVENAVRYSNHGGSVSVKIESGNNCARLLVADDGIGISPEEQSRIFERFYRVEKSRSVRSGGTGLGLSIVKHICALYDWKLSLKSKLGVGTEVTVTVHW